jgi:hypothetical protein
MQKTGTVRVELGRAILYAEDIVEIARIMQTTTTILKEPLREYEATVSLSALDHLFTVGELETLRETLRENRAPELTFRLGLWNRLSFHRLFATADVNDDPAMLGAVHQIRSYLDRRCRPAVTLPSVPVCIGLSGAAAFGVVFAMFRVYGSFLSATLAGAAASAGVLVFGFEFIQRLLPCSTIYLMPKADHKTWWGAYKSKLGFEIIKAIPVLLLGAAITFAVQKCSTGRTPQLPLTTSQPTK